MISSLFRHLRKGAARQAGDAHFLSTGHLLPVLQHLSKFLNGFAASFWRGAARLTHSITHGFLSVVTFLICENPEYLVLLVTAFCLFFAMDKVPGFLMSVFTQVTSQAGIKENLRSNSPLPHHHSKHQKDHTSDIRTLCAHYSVEEPRVAQTLPSRGQEETAAEKLAGALESKLRKSSHICPNKAHVSTIRQTANGLQSTNFKSLNSLWDMNNLKVLQSRG